MSLRTRLITAVTVLLLLVIAIFGYVAVATQRRVLMAQINERLEFALRQPFRQSPDRERGGGDRLLAELVIGPDGRIIGSAPSGIEVGGDPLPAIRNLPTPPVGEYQLLTLAGGGDAPSFRVGVLSLPDGYRLVVGQPLDDVMAAAQAMRSRLFLAGLAILAGGAGAVWMTVRRGLRPVDDMIDTATAIADGDLSRRVTTEDPETELGRLGGALNHMLTNIEGAFNSESRANERLKQFVADASHELRTPLAAIAGYSELHRKGALAEPEATDRAMNRIESETKRMTHLVEDLLLLARLDLDQAPDREPVELRGLLEDAAADSRAIDPERAVTVSGPPQATVMGDHAQLTQVVANLLANARDHTAAATPIHIELHDRADEVELIVKDEGPGFAAEVLGSVFDRFSRADSSRSRKSGGAGLGLAIVDAIARAHGGRTGASNDPGARVEVILPKILAKTPG